MFTLFVFCFFASSNAIDLWDRDKYVVIDSGGGTVDIAYHKQESEGIRELLPPSGTLVGLSKKKKKKKNTHTHTHTHTQTKQNCLGGNWGSEQVTDNIIEDAAKICGFDTIKDFQEKHDPKSWIQFRESVNTEKIRFFTSENKPLFIEVLRLDKTLQSLNEKPDQDRPLQRDYN